MDIQVVLQILGSVFRYLFNPLQNHDCRREGAGSITETTEVTETLNLATELACL